MRSQISPAVSAAVVLPPTFPQRFLVFQTSKTAHRSRTTGIAPLIMGSLDSFEAGIVTVDVKTAKNLLHSGYAFLDVRTVEEFKEGHVATEKIVNIPYQFNSPDGRVKNDRFLEDVSAVFKKDDRLVVGCRSGVRSLLAIEDLRNDGFKHLTDLGGGHLAWLEYGFPVAKPKVKTDPKSVDLKADEL
ncbi:thiosulfate sulfurtransferase 18-like isoform X1 [Cucurbita pepo subsp. pepo]|uniref:thiosulfate sulfurtransferase 18-like isoform X1 n=1 Tax=Cucurbita pepo subsp. pepo TaxID=3664 RepID=UPI000C9D30BD|nr:thiosulfate sulfurtransferase 18-like isoform X1 [Cucurbita pepo subsp. pepo]